MDIFFLIGRIFLGGYFLYNAYNHLVHHKKLTAYAKTKKIPLASTAVIVSGLLILFGGYSILTGTRVEAGIAALVLFLIPVTYSMHAFWEEIGPARSTETVQFMKNLALLGAVIMLLYIPTPWPLSLSF